MNRFLRQARLLVHMNWVLTLLVLALITIGVFFVYSACYVSQEQPVRELYRRQILWAAAGLIGYLVFAGIDYRSIRKLSWWAYALSLLLLVLVLIVGTRVYGARRWLMFLGIGVQPSEIAKIAMILVLARLLSRPGPDFGRVRPVLGVLLVVALPVLLVMAEPDLGTAMVFLPVAFVMMFAAGVPFRTLGVLVAIAVLAVSLVFAALYVPRALGASEREQHRIMRMVGLSPYHRDRLNVFFAADSDPLGAGWNKRQSVIAVGSGGLHGKGYLQGTQNILGYLPRSVAPTDFIYAVIAEEKGFVGSAVVLGLFALVILCGLIAAMRAPDRMGRLLCSGVTAMIFCHVFINIAMTVGLMPITGLPLPLLSYGGSFMIVMMMSLGMVQSVHIRSRREGLEFTQGALWQTV